MKKRRLACGCAAALVLLPGLVLGVLGLWQFARPQPSPDNRTLFSGIEYTRDVRSTPRDMVIHVMTVDLQAEGIRLLVTPGDPEAEYPLKAETTSAFLEGYDLQAAVNGDGFEPWSSFSLFSYYPHPGDPVGPIGYAASRGEPYSDAHPDSPTLYLSQNNKARFERPFENLYNAISGTEMLVRNGRITAAADSTPEPRTAVGLDRSEKKLILVVIDGRQPGYSEGATLRDLAEVLVFYGAHDAMNLDGGGSSTMVRAGTFGRAVLLNNPIDRNIPGWERAVGNHIGIYAETNE